MSVDPRDPTTFGVAVTPTMVKWIAVAVMGAFLLSAWPILAHLYWLEQAGSKLDRNIVSGDADALARAQQILGLRPVPDGAPAHAAPPESGSFADSPDYWRTYGAVAARAPSEAAFDQLEAAQRRGKLDRMGGLWLGEVAAATGHWDVAAREYGRVGAVNLLVERGDEAAAAGRADAAAHWYETAATSLLAAIEAERAEPRESPSSQELFDTGSGQTILLLRVGRGLLSAGLTGPAIRVLEHAEAELRANPPGIRDQQAVHFALAEALAKTPVSDPRAAHDRETRIGTLLAEGVTAEDSGWARLQEAKIRLLTGQRAEALRALHASLRLDPKSVEANLALGEVLEADGLLSLARDQYARGLDAAPGDVRLLCAWAKASYATMDPALALPRLREAAATATRDPYVFVALGNSLIALGDQEGARAAYREGLRRAPGAEPLRSRLYRFARPNGQSLE